MMSRSKIRGGTLYVGMQENDEDGEQMLGEENRQEVKAAAILDTGCTSSLAERESSRSMKNLKRIVLYVNMMCNISESNMGG